MRIIFRPKTNTFQDILVAIHAARVWQERQDNIIQMLEKYSGLTFRQKTIYARSGAFSGDFTSGFPKYSAMDLPLASRLEGGEIGTYHRERQYVGNVGHELAHHLLLEHDIVAPSGQNHDFVAHQHIYLFLLDAWKDAYDPTIAEEFIADEAAIDRKGYAEAFHWANDMSFTERQRTLKYLVCHKKLPKSSGAPGRTVARLTKVATVQDTAE